MRGCKDELGVFLNVGQPDRLRSFELRSVIDRCDCERPGGESLSSIGIGDDIVESDGAVEVGIRGEAVIAVAVV